MNSRDAGLEEAIRASLLAAQAGGGKREANDPLYVLMSRNISPVDLSLLSSHTTYAISSLNRRLADRSPGSSNGSMTSKQVELSNGKKRTREHSDELPNGPLGTVHKGPTAATGGPPRRGGKKPKKEVSGVDEQLEDGEFQHTSSATLTLVAFSFKGSQPFLPSSALDWLRRHRPPQRATLELDH